MGKKLVWEGGESRSDRKVFYCPQLLVCAPGNKGSSVESFAELSLPLSTCHGKKKPKKPSELPRSELSPEGEG